MNTESSSLSMNGCHFCKYNNANTGHNWCTDCYKKQREKAYYARCSPPKNKCYLCGKKAWGDEQYYCIECLKHKDVRASEAYKKRLEKQQLHNKKSKRKNVLVLIVKKNDCEECN